MPISKEQAKIIDDFVNFVESLNNQKDKIIKMIECGELSDFRASTEVSTANYPTGKAGEKFFTEVVRKTRIVVFMSLDVSESIEEE